MSSFRRFRFHAKEAIFGIASTSVMNLATVTTVALSLFILGMFLLFLRNLNIFLDDLRNQYQITLFLEHSIGADHRRVILDTLNKNQYVVNVSLITKEQALNTIREELNNAGSPLPKLKKNPLPDTIEIYVTESAPFKPAESPYGNTKKICEDILRDTSASDKNINTIALRYFNPIGAHESALIGEIPKGVPNNLIPFVTQTAAGIREELSVFGDDYDTPDGSCIRDYIHVVDLAKAHVVAVKRLLEKKNKKNYEFFNLGTGTGTSVLEVVKSFEKVSGEKLKYKIVGRREGDIEKVWADTSFSNEELGWKTEKTLDEALLSAWKWEQNYRSK